MQFGGGERGPQPAQVLVAGVGQGDGAAGEHRRGDPGLSQAAFGHAPREPAECARSREATASVFRPIASTSTRNSGMDPRYPPTEPAHKEKG